VNAEGRVHRVLELYERVRSPGGATDPELLLGLAVEGPAAAALVGELRFAPLSLARGRLAHRAVRAVRPGRGGAVLWGLLCVVSPFVWRGLVERLQRRMDVAWQGLEPMAEERWAPGPCGFLAAAAAAPSDERSQAVLCAVRRLSVAVDGLERTEDLDLLDPALQCDRLFLFDHLLGAAIGELGGRDAGSAGPLGTLICTLAQEAFVSGKADRAHIVRYVQREVAGR
jgi:hypothetical protein